MSTKRSHILKQACSFQLQACLSMCDLLVDTRHQRVKKLKTLLELKIGDAFKSDRCLHVNFAKFLRTLACRTLANDCLSHNELCHNMAIIYESHNLGQNVWNKVKKSSKAGQD